MIEKCHVDESQKIWHNKIVGIYTFTGLFIEYNPPNNLFLEEKDHTKNAHHPQFI